MIEFRSSDIDKKDLLINAALEEFSENGYKKASTNNIVKQAGVSKGLLYHYFKSKDELYEYLIEFCFDTVGKKIKSDTDWSITDFFERLKNAVLVKFELSNVYPAIYDFAIKVMKNLPPERIKELTDKHALDLLAKIYYENIDFSKFKEGTDIPRLIQTVQWTFEKYGDVIKESENINIEEIMNEIDQYIDMFKQGYYK